MESRVAERGGAVRADVFLTVVYLRLNVSMILLVGRSVGNARRSRDAI
jgi:hypothetical protein